VAQFGGIRNRAVVMYVLDTDHLSLVQRGGAAGQQILSRMAHLRKDELFVTVISYEEQVKGWFKVLSAAKRREETVFGYLGLQQMSQDYCEIAMLPFDIKKTLGKFQAYEVKLGDLMIEGENRLLEFGMFEFCTMLGRCWDEC
jgi:predicted nucleic acid-binding protein